MVVVVAFILAALLEQVDTLLGIALANTAVVLLLGIMLDRVSTLTTAAQVRIVRSEAEAHSEQHAFVTSRSPRRIRMCEYSAQSVIPLLDAMHETGTPRCVQLLLCHPLHTWGDYQEERRVLPGIARLPRHLPLDSVEQLGVRVRCYSVPGALRGRNYNDELIVTGWYTYERRREIRDKKQIWGHDNALVLAPTSHQEGRVLRKMFNDVFDRMWAQSDTLEEAAHAYSEQHGELGIDDDWLAAVSGPLPQL